MLHSNVTENLSPLSIFRDDDYGRSVFFLVVVDAHSKCSEIFIIKSTYVLKSHREIEPIIP